MRIGIVTDTHLRASVPGPDPSPDPALNLLETVLARFREPPHPDLVLHLGDISEDGAAPGADETVCRVRDLAAALPCPFLAIPGNHDAPADAVRRFFGPYPRRHDAAGVSVLLFEDVFAADASASRAEDDFAWLLEKVGDPASVTIAVQHAPVFPAIEDDYPFNLSNRERVHQAFVEAGIGLSLSGHYHREIEPTEHHGVLYAVAPSLCEPPHPYVLLELRDGNIDWSVRTL